MDGIDSLQTAIKDYKDLMALTVCDLNSRECMIHRCNSCPGNDALNDHFLSVFTKFDMDENDILTFKQ